jgi:hypothetical protein
MVMARLTAYQEAKNLYIFHRKRNLGQCENDEIFSEIFLSLN